MMRPELKLTCGISDGLEEVYYLMDNDVTTTANLDLTLLSDMMNQAVETRRSRNVPLPKNLRVHADNATSETRNQTALKWGAVMAYRSMFSQVAYTYYAVGHSHGLPDQRFSEVRGKLCSESVLQTPEDFLSAVKKVQAPSSGVLRAERCSSLFDFKALMEQLQVDVSGHVSTHNRLVNNVETVHSFTLMTRETFCFSVEHYLNFVSFAPHLKFTTIFRFDLFECRSCIQSVIR